MSVVLAMLVAAAWWRAVPSTPVDTAASGSVPSPIENVGAVRDDAVDDAAASESGAVRVARDDIEDPADGADGEATGGSADGAGARVSSHGDGAGVAAHGSAVGDPVDDGAGTSDPDSSGEAGLPAGARDVPPAVERWNAEVDGLGAELRRTETGEGYQLWAADRVEILIVDDPGVAPVMVVATRLGTTETLRWLLRSRAVASIADGLDTQEVLDLQVHHGVFLEPENGTLDFGDRVVCWDPMQLPVRMFVELAGHERVCVDDQGR